MALTKEPFKVAIYCRVSKDENEKDNRYQNPENQLKALREYCQAQKWEIESEYTDRWSGADPNRPQFKELLIAANRRYFDAILVWKLDRFSREPMFVVMGYIRQLKEKNVGLISMTESWLDTRDDNPMSELILSIMTWMAAEERRKISERTKLGIEKKKSDGTYKGGRPKGSTDKKPRKKKGYYLKKGGLRNRKVSL